MIRLPVNNILIVLITFFTLVLPYAKIRIGAMPLYFLDVIMFGAISLLAPYQFKKSRLGMAFVLYWLLTIIMGFFELLIYGSIESIYMLMRYSLSMGSLIVLPKLINTPDKTFLLLKTMSFCLFINAALAVSFVFPISRQAASVAFSQEILYPQRDRFQEGLVKEESERGRTLAGNANASAFLIFTGLIAGLTYIRMRRGFGPLYLYLGMALGSLAIIFTQSRAAYLTLILLVLYILWQPAAKVYRKYIVLGGIILFASFFLGGINDETVDFDRIKTTVALLQGQEEIGYSEKARILSWTLPFQLILEHPKYLLIGRGFSISKINKRSEEDIKTDFALKSGMNHSFFASITYERGLLAFLVFCYILYKSFSLTFNGRRFYDKAKTALTEMNKMLLINLLLPLAVAHYLTDSVFGSYQLFFVFAVVISISKFLNE